MLPSTPYTFLSLGPMPFSTIVARMRLDSSKPITMMPSGFCPLIWSTSESKVCAFGS